jgi:hypothetical protein
VIDSSRTGALVGAGPSHIASSRLPDAGELGDRQPLTPLPPVRPARARPSGRAQQAEPDLRAGERLPNPTHVHVAAGGVLDPLEPNSATHAL